VNVTYNCLGYGKIFGVFNDQLVSSDLDIIRQLGMFRDATTWVPDARMSFIYDMLSI
jgi:hypothetical protein